MIGDIYYLLRDLDTVRYRGSDGRTVCKGKDKAKADEKEHVLSIGNIVSLWVEGSERGVWCA